MSIKKSESYFSLLAVADAPNMAKDGTVNNDNLNTVLFEAKMNAHLMKMVFIWN
ncbi:MAG: hypothetical protein KJS92_01175 [Bacteroidetes bacterium]|nr:hypothetical protein [Bacteroidota bacterium]